MSGYSYPLGRWSVGEKSMGASVWTGKVSEAGEPGGGYYLYRWERDTDVITLAELVKSSSKADRQWPVNKPSTYVPLATLPVPAEIRELDESWQEFLVAKIMYTNMAERFGKFAEWIPYDSSGRVVWFHNQVTGDGKRES